LDRHSGGVLNLWNGDHAFKKYALNTSTQGQTAITSLYQDTENNYWIGSNKGLYFLSLTMVISIY
jgi:ligand-binding sensor domain-containing protein